MPQLFSDPEAVVDDIIRDVGKTLVVGLPLGLGKANHIVNALYARAAADPSIDLTLFSALTLEKPKPASLLESRFGSPVVERLFGGYPDLAYVAPLRAGRLPPNIKVLEFFFLAGRWLHVPFAQQHYISANYTHAASYLLERGLNVVLQLVAKRVVDGETRYSLSCNTDTTLDIMRARSEGRANFKLIAQVNSELPFMPGPGDLPASEFSAVLDSPATDFPLFAPPAEPISDTKYAIGLHAASLVRDGGTLQIGIGQVGDALAQGLIVRHRNNAQFLEVMARLAPGVAPRETRHVRQGPLRRQRDGVRGVSRPDRRRHPEARGGWRDPARRVLHRTEGVLPRAARDEAGGDCAHLHDAGLLHQCALWRRSDKTPGEGRCALRQQCDDGDPDGGGDIGWPGGRAGHQRRRRPVQFRGAGVCACRRALGAGAGGGANGRAHGAIQHPLVLWAPDHSAASARCLRHRVRHRRRARKVGRGGDRGDAGNCGLALPE